MVESKYNHEAISPAGALGLTQLMPATAQLVGVRYPFDPQQNIEGGARYLRGLLTRFKGDERLALAGYNAGPATIAALGKVPDISETRNYVQRVLSVRKQIRSQRMASICSIKG
jgi:soluble lytic murein transglycosylase-like protein